MNDDASASAPPPPVTRGSAWKIVASVVVVTGAVGFMLKASVKEGAEFYKHVDEVMTNTDAWRGKKLQVHGNVVNGSIEQAKGTLMYRFEIESLPPRPHAVISASYTGLVPDTFKSGAEVVAKGTLMADNKLDVVPDGIMAKCPSKYNADKVTAKIDDPGVAAK
ncbi:MAG TPA: cytochrome c maturation protein CcmE [Polyangia bacterium]|jgi:cytochrome c-type biogenesis protein CcmE|nr:cytochrome c maturation protein CcmE [Polyangia bacterium]